MREPRIAARRYRPIAIDGDVVFPVILARAFSPQRFRPDSPGALPQATIARAFSANLSTNDLPWDQYRELINQRLTLGSISRTYQSTTYLGINIANLSINDLPRDQYVDTAKGEQHEQRQQ